MSMTKSHPEFDRMMEEERRRMDNLHEDYKDARYWEKRYLELQNETNQKPKTDEQRGQ